MKITDVEVVVVRQDNVKMIGDGSQDTAVVLVHTDEGITGVMLMVGDEAAGGTDS